MSVRLSSSSALPASGAPPSGAPARTPRGGAALLALTGVLWGTGGLAGSLLGSLAGLSPVAVATLRLLCGGVLLTAYCAVTGRLSSVPRTRAAAGRVALSGALLAVYQSAYFASMAATSVGLATLTTMVTVPVLVTAGSAALERRRPARREIAALLVAGAGLVLLLGSPSGQGGDRVAGTALALLAAAGFAALTLDRRPMPAGLDPVGSTGLGFLAGGVLLLPAGLAAGMGLPARADAAGVLAFLALVPTALAYTGYFAGLRRAGAAAGVVAVLLEPLTATLLAAVLGREHLSGTQLAGAAAVLVSIVVRQGVTRRGAPRPGRTRRRAARRRAAERKTPVSS